MYKHYETSDDVFVDREEYIEWLEEALVRCKKKSVVLHLKGIGGIGKSSLLKHWIRTNEKTVRVDCEQYTGFYDRLNIIAKGAVLHGVNLQRFDVLWQIRQRFVEGVEPVREEGRAWAKDVVMAIPFIGSLASIGSAITAVGSQVTPKLKGKYSTVGKWLQDRLGKNHIEQLLEILWKDPRRAEFLFLDAILEDINTRKEIEIPILFLFDHYEYVNSEMSHWRYQGKKICEAELWTIFLSSLENCVGVMAGRKPAVKRDDVELEETELTELDRDSCVEMLELQGITDKELQESIISVTGGNPFVIDAICDMPEAGGLSTADVESLRAETLEEVRVKTWRRLFKQAQDLLSIVDRAGLLPYFNKRIMEIIAPDMKTDQFNRLLDLSFVIQRDDGNYVLHDLAEELVRAELGNRLHVLAEEVSGLLERAWEEDSDFVLLGFAISTKAITDPRSATKDLLEVLWKLGTTFQFSKVLEMVNNTSIESPEGEIVIQSVKAYNLSNLMRYAEADHIMSEIIEPTRQLAKDEPELYKKTLAFVMLVKGYLLLISGRDAESSYRETITLYREILETIRERGETPEFDVLSYYLMTLYNFGLLLSSTYRLNEAGEHLEEILDLNDDYVRSVEGFGKDAETRFVWGVNFALSGVYSRAGKYNDAIKACRDALAVAIESRGRERMLTTLGFVLWRVNRLEEAEETFRKALELQREFFAAEADAIWQAIFDSINGLAWTLVQTNRFTEAKGLIDEGLGIVEEFSTEDTPIYDGLQRDILAVFNLMMGRFSEAEEMERQALEFMEKAVERTPTNRMQLIDVQNNLSVILRKVGKLEESDEYYSTSLEIARELSEIYSEGWIMPYRISTILNNVGVLRRHQNQIGDAEEFYRESIALKREWIKKTPDITSSYLAVSLNNIGVLLAETERYSESVDMLEEALSINREMSKHSADIFDPRIAMNLNNLGILFSRTKKNNDAEEAFKNSIKIYEGYVKKAPEVYQSELTKVLCNLSLISPDKKILSRLSDLGVNEIPERARWSEEEEFL